MTISLEHRDTVSYQRVYWWCIVIHKNNVLSGVTRSMVIPGPETEVIGESRSGGLGAQPPDAEKGLILHVLRIS